MANIFEFLSKDGNITAIEILATCTTDNPGEEDHLLVLLQHHQALLLHVEVRRVKKGG